MKKFEFLEHTADIKFRAYGKTISEMFENSALAITNIMSKDKVKPKISKTIKIEGENIESLMYTFLEEILFLVDTEDFLVASCKVKVDEKNNKLEAKIKGDDIKKYKTGLDVKAVTYNEMFVKKERKEWVVQIVVDV